MDLETIEKEIANLPDEAKATFLVLIDHYKKLEARHKKLDHFAGMEETDSFEKGVLLSDISEYLTAIAKTDPHKPISRMLRDRGHIIRGRILENGVNAKCGCGTCGDIRSQDRYEKAQFERDKKEKPNLCEFCRHDVPPEYHDPTCPHWKVGDL